MKKVVITGANGFIGSSLTKYLSEKKYMVYAIVRNKDNSTKIGKLSNVKIIECEMCNYKYLNEFIDDKEIDVVYHFAWEGSAGEKRSDYSLQLENVEYSCDLIKALNNLKVKRFVFAGSLMEYEYLKSIENSNYNISINNIYGISKFTARNLLQTLAINYNVEFIPTIISNIYGWGETSDRLVNSTIRKMISRQKTEFTECNQLYDFIYITDAIKAFYLIGKRGKAFKNYYIGNRSPIRLKRFIISIRDLINKNIEPGFGKIEFKGIGLEYNEFNTHSLYEDFGFEPEISFEQGVKETIKWIRTCEYKEEK